MNRIALSAACVSLIVLAGCGGGHPQPCQRFLPVGNAQAAEGKDSRPTVPRYAALALDTKTGSLCLTYQYKVDVDYPEWKEIPTCKSLYEKYPE